MIYIEMLSLNLKDANPEEIDYIREGRLVRMTDEDYNDIVNNKWLNITLCLVSSTMPNIGNKFHTAAGLLWLLTKYKHQDLERVANILKL